MFKIEDGREHFYQWDLNRRLLINDASITNVHFCNKTDDCSLNVEVYEEGGNRYADVPNILLQEAWNIRAYAYCGHCYTKQKAVYKVEARSMPAEYVYTETQVATWYELEERIDEKVNAMDSTLEDFEKRADEAARNIDLGLSDLHVTLVSFENVSNSMVEGYSQELANLRLEYNNDIKQLEKELEEDLTEYDSTFNSSVNTFETKASKALNTFKNNSNNALNEFDNVTDEKARALDNALSDYYAEKILIDEAKDNANNAASAAYAAADEAHKAAMNINEKFTNALKGNASGKELVQLNDVSPIAHDVTCQLESKNYCNAQLLLEHGYTLQEDGSYKGTIKGKPFVVFDNTEGIQGAFTISYTGRYIGAPYTESGFTWLVTYTDGTDEYKASLRWLDDEVRYTTGTTNANKTVKAIYLSYGRPHECQVWDMQIERGATATAYEPYKDVAGAKVKTQGKNFLDINTFVINEYYTSSYAKDLIIDGNSLTFARIGTAQTSGIYTDVYLPVGTYTVSGSCVVSDGSTACGWGVYDKETKTFVANYSNSGMDTRTFTITEVKTYSFRLYCPRDGAEGTRVTYTNVQIEAGNTATDYEKYVEPITYTADEKGNLAIGSIAPTTTLSADGVSINAEYNKDINKVIEKLVNAIISLGGNV